MAKSTKETEEKAQRGKKQRVQPSHGWLLLKTMTQGTHGKNQTFPSDNSSFCEFTKKTTECLAPLIVSFLTAFSYFMHITMDFFFSALGKQAQANFCEFKASMI